ncbi:MAG TPA: hypothetical protein VK034_28205 [Enhygromyxa sp.]|nr:hypothetical protein [Enhygromyxa sp.]
MSEIDRRTSNAIAHLRTEWSPPEGAEDRMLADFHARLGGPPPGAGELGSGSVGAAGHGLYVAKIILAIAGLTGAGLGGLVVVAKLVGPAAQQPAPPRELSVASGAGEVEPEPELEPSASESIDTIESEPAPVAASTLDAPSSPVLRSSRRAPAESKIDLAAELALIQQARAARPEQALALLDRHAREFSDGAMASEREALRAVNACTLDRLADARAAVDRLVALEPGPLLRQRVLVACEKKIELPTTDFARGGDGSP